jgi:hypothetical protein
LIFGFLCERGGVEVDAEILTPSRNRKMQVKGPYYYQTVPGLLDKKEVSMCHLIVKGGIFFRLDLSNELGTGLTQF